MRLGVNGFRWFFVCFTGMDSLPYSGSEDEEDDETTSNSISSTTKHHLITGLHGTGPGSILPPTTPEANNNSLSAGDLQASHSALDLKEDSEDQGEESVLIANIHTYMCTLEHILAYKAGAV